MGTKFFAGGIDDIAGLEGIGALTFDKRTIIAVRYKADVLAFGALGGGRIEFGGYGTHFGFGHTTYGEEQAREFLSQSICNM
jgi:hypothetical protein